MMPMDNGYTVSRCSVILCGIVRNAEKGLKKNIPVISKFLSCCRDFRVFVYENDSTDDTKRLLRDWQSSDSERIHVSLNDNDPYPVIPSWTERHGANPFFSRKRIGKMSRLRNEYMEQIERLGWEADYLMVVDLDVAWLDLEGILSSFGTRTDWDAVTAFGYSTSPKLRRRYHDSYALTLWDQQDAPQTERSIKLNASRLGSVGAGDDWIRIASGFGGLAIYKWEAVKGLRYQVIDNDDQRVEVRCEHYSICRQMIERGYDRIYINPAMQLKYQDLTFSIVWNSLKRGLSGLV